MHKSAVLTGGHIGADNFRVARPTVTLGGVEEARVTVWASNSVALVLERMGVTSGGRRLKSTVRRQTGFIGFARVRCTWIPFTTCRGHGDGILFKVGFFVQETVLVIFAIQAFARFHASYAAQRIAGAC